MPEWKTWQIFVHRTFLKISKFHICAPYVPQRTPTFLKEPPRSSKNPYRLGTVPHVPQESPYVPQNRINTLLYTYVTYYAITG